jgi:hypothetical protein
MAALAPTPVAVEPTDRPVSWRRLVWVVWRRYRPFIAGLALLVIALSAYLLVTGEQLRSAYDAVASCRPPAHSSACEFTWADFVDHHGNAGFVAPFQLLLPGIIGVFVGAPLLGRELESGVFRFSWTQGVGRMRLAVAMIVPAAIVTALITVGLGMLEMWHNQPLLEAGVRQRLDPSTFPIAGPAVAGWTWVAFAGGMLAGLLWKRVVPAIVSSFAVWFGLAYVGSATRLHYLAPLTTSSRDLGVRNVMMDQWWTKDGARVSDAALNKVLESVGAQVSDNGFHAEVGRGGTDPVQYLADHGYAQITQYQPDGRYWNLQWIEFGWLFALSLVLLGATMWLLRRHSA